MTLGKSVKLFLVDGSPGGLVTAEIMNWTGHILAAPRSQLRALLQRTESTRTGVYILIGDAPASVGGVQVYVGEGDDISIRLIAHAKNRDFWDRAVIITSKDANLTKAHARYLESRFIQIARAARRSEVVNATSPPPLPLPEADVSDMESFILETLIALPVLGINALRDKTVKPNEPGGPQLLQRAHFSLTQKRNNVVANAVEMDGEFMVLAGSSVQRLKGSSSYSGLRDRLEAEGVLDISTDPGVFTIDQVFASPSAAAAVVLGRSANGRAAWVEESTGETYGAWQLRGVD